MFRTCTFESIFILPFHLIDSLVGYRILDRKDSPENFERIPLLCSSYIVAVKKSNSSLIIDAMSVICFFFLTSGCLYDVLFIHNVTYLTCLGWGC